MAAYHSGSKPDFLQISPHNLESFVVDHLQPTTEYNRVAEDLIDRLVNYLQHNVGYSVNRVVKSGSFGKGTQVKDSADLDCIMVINELNGLDDLLHRSRTIIGNLKNGVEKASWAYSIQNVKTTRFAVQFDVTTKADGKTNTMSVDLLPTFDALGQHSSQDQRYRAYNEAMTYIGSDKVNYYSVALGQLQVDFVRGQPTRVKNLIRLVKYWRKEVMLKKANRDFMYPTSYPMELITIYTWQNAGKQASFDMAEAFKAVLMRLMNYSSLDIAWYENYNQALAAQAKSKMTRPILLDPANPTNNVFSLSNPPALEHMSELARDTMQKPLLRGVSINYPWNK
ncbi:2'-5'-oligoadenylate synthase 2-like [Saccoglossus kowalevskii]|uniref:2'-5'-oligoadenylate synthase 3-like n=1 Tax=Saccoglossus kowalevskii TaxID=10224 RepID=A0ABM0LW16_SACKO|nr:PREDICTED: 2'-5'-oligoadenylate synthase 3-like [Saccoglossus kowalevskii]